MTTVARVVTAQRRPLAATMAGPPASRESLPEARHIDSLECHAVPGKPHGSATRPHARSFSAP